MTRKVVTIERPDEQTGEMVSVPLILDIGPEMNLTDEEASDDGPESD